MPKNIRLTRMISRAGDVAWQLSNLQFSDFYPTPGWRPDLNAYRYDDRFEICVDLAGVDKGDIVVEVLTDRLRLSGERHQPAPECRDCRQVIALEIQSGHFAREFALPAEVMPEKVTARQENGLLWIVLPIRDRHGRR
ncbi:MAG: Hsp20/alpha crystallin family protein [Verrucomicrobiales bacterium]|nr:Hsp20/alpha crystallin family protein [Verrucomicrobiales bacterium]